MSITPSTPGNTTTELAYAPAPPWHQRRMGRKLLWIAITVAVVVLGSGVWRYKDRVVALYWQRQAFATEGKPATVMPPEYLRFDATKQFRMMQTVTANCELVFRGDIELPNDDRRLVAVEIHPRPAGGQADMIAIRVTRPGTWRTLPSDEQMFVAGTRNRETVSARSDPDDPSHIVVSWLDAGDASIQDVWFTTSGVKFEERPKHLLPTPTTAPSSQPSPG